MYPYDDERDEVYTDIQADYWDAVHEDQYEDLERFSGE